MQVIYATRGIIFFRMAGKPLAHKLVIHTQRKRSLLFHKNIFNGKHLALPSAQSIRGRTGLFPDKTKRDEIFIGKRCKIMRYTISAKSVHSNLC
jgi:hypothetical protein